jgi:hypothetical protein
MHLGGDTGSERSNVKKKKGPLMALRESGSPSPYDYFAEWDPLPAPPAPRWLHRLGHAIMWTPLLLALLAPVLYLLYALGFI